MARQFSQDEDIILSENHRDNGAGLVGTDKFGVHHNTGYTSVTIMNGCTSLIINTMKIAHANGSVKAA